MASLVAAVEVSDAANETCSICMEQFEEETVTPSSAAAVRLVCNHVFHLGCLESQIDARCSTSRLTFGYLHCALCRTPMQRDIISSADAHFQLQDQVFKVCRKRATEDDAIAGLEAMHLGDAFQAVMQQMAAYHCARCEAVFCAGKAECAASVEIDPRTLLCQDCAWRDARSDHKCGVHGAAKAIFKCDCCCAVATYDCSGNHYCDSCHARPYDGGVSRPECQGRVCDKCPLSLLHPPNVPRCHETRKIGFVIGCTACLGIDNHCEMAVSSQTAQDFS